MSLQLTELAETMVAFPPGKNVRVKITGLALCEFNTSLSTIRFLRHVKHHELTMKITQMRSDMTGTPKTFTVKIEPTQNVEISASTISTVASHVFDQSLDDLIKMKSFLHDNRPLVDRNPLPEPHPTWLKLNHCAFYTHQLTEGTYKFRDVDDTQKPLVEKQYCQVLGGYLAYSGTLTISILSNGIPLTFPLTDFLYEIEFRNSCDTSPGCRDEEDFRFMYDIVKESQNPGRVFKLVKGPRAVDTGACLPACPDC